MIHLPIHRAPLKTAAAAVVAGIILAWLLAGCGVNARHKALSASLVAVNAARDSFVAYDLRKQEDILAASGSGPAFRVEILDYRQKREGIVKLFEHAYRAIASAAILTEDREAYESVGTAMTTLLNALKVFTGDGI